MFVGKSKRYPVRPDRPDWRDYRYKSTNLPLRDTVDLRQWASPVEEQDDLGSCTGQAVVGAYELLLNQKATDHYVDLSRLFVYYNARLIEDTVDEDAGAYVRGAIKAVKNYGVCSEVKWPYLIENYRVVPPVESYEDAKKRGIKNYYRIAELKEILDAVNNNYPVIFGTYVYDSFDELGTGDAVVPMPTEVENILGSHAMCIVGYDIPNELLLARNSYGADWCINGYCWIPFEYARFEFTDMWVIDIDLRF